MNRLSAGAALAALLLVTAAGADPAVRGKGPGRFIWIQGHGEPSIESQGPEGLSGLRTALAATFPGTEISVTTLKALPDAPPEDAVLVLAGPKRDLSEADAARLSALVSGGARLLVCIDPRVEHDQTDLSRLRGVLRAAGIEAGTDRVVDTERAVAKPAAPPMPVPPKAVFSLLFDASDHPLLALLPRGTVLAFADACRVAAMSGRADPFDARELASTSSTAIAQSAAGDRSQAGPVLVAAMQRAGPGRLVVAGDSSFLANSFSSHAGFDGSPLALYGAATVAALLIIGNAVLRR